MYRRIPTLLNAGKGNPTLYRDSLRVTSARVDPCPDPASCIPELRLVWQPIEYDTGEAKWSARDAALHCVYTMSETEFADLKHDLWDIKTKYQRLGIDTTLAPLEVHPALRNRNTTVVASSTRVVRAFGYFGDKPAVSQRTIHDSVVSAHWLNLLDDTTSLPRGLAQAGGS